MQKTDIYESLTPDDFKARKLVVTVVGEIDVLPTKYGDKPAVLVKPDNSTKHLMWWLNQTSINTMIDLFGEESDNWKHKKVQLRTKTQLVNGVERRVILVEEKPLKSKK